MGILVVSGKNIWKKKKARETPGYKIRIILTDTNLEFNSDLFLLKILCFHIYNVINNNAVHQRKQLKTNHEKCTKNYIKQ